MTRAPAAAAQSPVLSSEPSSIPRISCHVAVPRRAVTSGPIVASSLKAGMTTDVVGGISWPGGWLGMQGGLRRKAEVDDVSVLHDVLFAFQAHFAVVAARGHRASSDQRIVGDNLRADEAAGAVP